MNVSTTSFSPTQMILAWILLILLLCWFIIFAALAFRNFFMKKDELDEVSTPSRPIQIIGIQSKGEQQNLVGMTGNTLHHERPQTERSRDSGTSLIR